MGFCLIHSILLQIKAIETMVFEIIAKKEFRGLKM